MSIKRDHVAAFAKLRDENGRQVEALRALKATINGPALTPRTMMSSLDEASIANGPVEMVVRTRRNWNQEFQALCAAPVGGEGASNAARRHSHHSLWAASHASLQQHQTSMLSSRSTASTMSSASYVDVMHKIKRINSFVDEFSAEMLSVARSFVDDYIGEEPAVPITFVTGDEVTGMSVKVTLYDFEDRKAVSRIGKDITAQYRVLAQQLAFMAEPLVCMPLRTVMQFKGRLMVISALSDPPRGTTPPRLLRSYECIELKLVMDMLTETLNLAPYLASVDGKSKPERLTGPFHATCFRGIDGRLYMEDVCGLYPHFPPPRAGALDPTQHIVLLRHELVDSTFVSTPLSPASFIVFGAPDSVSHNINARETARIACQVAVSNLAQRFKDHPPESLDDLVERVHSNGVNIASLGLFLFYLTRGTPAYNLILTEMVARSMRELLVRLMSEQIESEEIHDAIQGAMAQINNPASSQEYFTNEVLPIMKDKFMGLASLLSDPNLSPSKAPTADCVNTKLLLGRLSVLVGLRFNDGVDENGMSPFHYPIADLLPVSKSALRLPVPFCAKVPFPSLDVACTPKGTAAADGLGIRHQLEQRPGASFAIERYLMARERQLAGAKAKDEVRAAFAHMYTMYDLSSHLNRYHKLSEKSLTFAEAALNEFNSLLAAQPHNADTFIFGGLALFEKAKASILVGPSSRDDPTSSALWSEGVVSDLRDAMHFFVPELGLSTRHGTAIGGAPLSSPSNPLSAKCVSVYGLVVGRELAAALTTTGCLPEVVPLLRWMVAASTTIYGRADSTTMSLEAQLGAACFRSDGDMDEAEGHLRAVLELNEVTKRPEDAFTVGSALNTLACLLSHSDRNEESIVYFTRDVELCVGTNGPAHPTVSQARSSLGAAHLKLGQMVKAEQEMLAALDGLRNTHGQMPNADIGDALVNVGALRAAQNRNTEADAHFMEAISCIQASEGDSSHRLLAPYEHLVRLAQLGGDTGKQAFYYSKVQSLRNTPHIPPHDKGIRVLPPL